MQDISVVGKARMLVLGDTSQVLEGFSSSFHRPLRASQQEVHQRHLVNRLCAGEPLMAPRPRGAMTGSKMKQLRGGTPTATPINLLVPVLGIHPNSNAHESMTNCCKAHSCNQIARIGYNFTAASKAVHTPLLGHTQFA